MKTLTRNLTALVFDALIVAAILITIAGFEYLIALMPLSPSLHVYLFTMHEWSTLAIFAIFVLKSVLRLLVSTSEQVDELAQSLQNDSGKKTDAPQSKGLT
jgi:hypothetical protein